jgi:hypothetical protein
MNVDSRSGGHRRALRGRWRVLVGAFVALLTVAVPTALAIHDFTDVPDSNPFHADIAAVKRAGITSGKTCDPPGTPPTYCPTEGITREAMAAFVHRGFGRVASDLAGNFLLDGGAPVDVAVVTIAVGGVAGQTQFVKLDGAVGAFSVSPPDDVAFQIVQDGEGPISIQSAFTLPAEGGSYGSGASTAAVAVPSGSTQTFRLQATDDSDTGGIAAWGELTALTVPFGSTGSSTLGGDPTAVTSAGVKGKK